MSSEHIVNLDDRTYSLLEGHRSVPDLEHPTNRKQELARIIHANFGTGDLYIPTTAMHALTSGKRLLDRTGAPLHPEVVRNLRKVATNLAFEGIASPGSQYGLGGISGDVAEITNMSVDDVEKRVLILPQATLRARSNSDTLTTLGMSQHPLARDRAMLEVMVQVATRAGIDAPYIRMHARANQGNGMALADTELEATVATAAFSFGDGDTPAYRTPAAPKSLHVQKHRMAGHPVDSVKHSSRYASRVLDFAHIQQTDETGDAAYMLPNALVADARCQNIVYVTENTATGEVKFIFVEESEGNNFFVGKTQRTALSLLRAGMFSQNITYATVTTPGELYNEVTTPKADLPSDLNTMRRALDHVDYMLVIGTYKSLGGVSGISMNALGSSFSRRFEPSEGIRTAVNELNDGFITSCYAINGGTEATRNIDVCGIFDYDMLTQGKSAVEARIHPAEHRLEDVKVRYTPQQFKF